MKKYYPPKIESYQIDSEKFFCESAIDLKYGSEGKPGSNTWTESEINDEGDF
ncbi:MAG: hypothetical protein ACI4TW_07420 [Prevotella sp.]